jgi:hypothetical protein
MYWHFDGEIMIHPEDGTDKYFDTVSTDFWLLDENVQVIRAFVESQRDFILAHKYQPTDGEVPWGESYPAMMAELNRLQPPDAYWFGNLSNQTKAALVAFRQELINNVDVYFPDQQRWKLAVVA